jgi:hypothetical protein
MTASQDSIDFFAKYKAWTVARSINCTDSTPSKEVSAYLIAVREEVAGRAFDVLGIDTKTLDTYSEKFIESVPKNDYASLVAVYKSLGSKEAEPEIDMASQNREELRPFARAYLFRNALKQLGLEWYLTSSNKAFAGKWQNLKVSPSVPFSSEGISFMAKYKDWISIKKLSISSSTKPEEVAAHLSSIRIATDRKAPQILGINTENLDIYAAGITENMRKSAANLEKITTELGSAEAKKRIDEACAGDQSLRDAAKIYLFSRMMQNIKIDLEVSPDTLMDMFPGLKIPKPKGRMPGQKKKKQ